MEEIIEPITQNLVGERAKYKVNAYKKDRDGLDEKPIVDFNFAERTLYGRIDQDIRLGSPKRSRILYQLQAQLIQSQESATYGLLCGHVSRSCKQL